MLGVHLAYIYIKKNANWLANISCLKALPCAFSLVNQKFFMLCVCIAAAASDFESSLDLSATSAFALLTASKYHLSLQRKAKCWYPTQGDKKALFSDWVLLQDSRVLFGCRSHSLINHTPLIRLSSCWRETF